MRIVLDSNILLRLVDSKAALHPIAVDAIRILLAQEDQPVTIPQSLFEFWVVATRPISSNGLGFGIAEAESLMNDLTARFPTQIEGDGLFENWKSLVTTFSCSGKVAHDARYVASMKTLDLNHLLTFNFSDFQRYPGLSILDPVQLTTPALP